MKTDAPRRPLRIVLGVLLWTIVAFCLAATFIPPFLDRIYYRGPLTDHFDGQHFFNPDGDDDRLKTSSGQSRWRFMLNQALGNDARPPWPEKIAVRQSRLPARVSGERMLVTWIGHATVLIQADGLNILTDPVWSNRAGPFGIGPARVAEPGVRFEDLPKIDLVLVSHNHYDHLDLSTLKRLWDRDKPAIVTGLGNDSVMRGRGIPAQALDWGSAAVLTDHDVAIESGLPRCDPMGACPGDRASVHVTRSHHWDSRWFADRNRALWSSFVVQLPHGNIFFAGDTGLGDGKWPAEAAAIGPIRFAAIPIGAFRFEPGQMASGSHVGPRGAIQIWNGLGRPFALPIHWGTFRLSYEAYDTPPRMLEAMLRCTGSDPVRFRAAALGQPFEVPSLRAAPPPDLAALAACEREGRFVPFR